MRSTIVSLTLLVSMLQSLVLSAIECKYYTIKDKDTCRSIAKSSNATYAQLLSWNPSLDVTCGNLGSQANGTICISNPLGDYALPSESRPASTVITTEAPIPSPTGIGTNARCGEWYFVPLGDDCSNIATNHSITRKDLLFLNPQLFENCTNLLAQVYYCVQPVGDISTYPGYGGSPTRPPINPISATSLPAENYFLGNVTSDTTVIPIANGTRLDCYMYTYFSNLTENPAADCWNLASVMGQSAEDFILWNPSLATKSEVTIGIASATTATTNPYAYPCTISANTSYCVMLSSPTPVPKQVFEPPTPLAAGVAENCTGYHQVASYDTCEDIMAQFSLDINQFYLMNPTVKSDCTGLALGTWYCISIWNRGGPPPDPEEADDVDQMFSRLTGSTTTESPSATPTGIVTPSPVQTGMVSGCNKFYKVKGGDGCWAIAHDNSIDLDDFYKWNPAVKADCTGLQPDFNVCIGVSARVTQSTSQATKTTTGNGVVTPTPTQDGMTGGCKKFYMVKKGDGCWTIAHDNSIELNDFYTWNPAVKTDCTGLQPDYNVCIGI